MPQPHNSLLLHLKPYKSGRDFAWRWRSYKHHQSQKHSDIHAIDSIYLKAMFLDSGTSIHIRNQYQTPETLGADRLANAVAAAAIFPKKPCVIIDSGTCIKFDFITRNNEYFGGSISPGIEMRFKALHEFTHQLPLLTQTEPVYLIGKNTSESIISGVINGTLAEVKGILEQYQMTHKDLQVILTGGDYALIERTIKTSVHVEPWLTLKGLNEIFLHQLR